MGDHTLTVTPDLLYSLWGGKPPKKGDTMSNALWIAALIAVWVPWIVSIRNAE